MITSSITITVTPRAFGKWLLPNLQVFIFFVISKTQVHTSNIYHHVLGSYWLGVQAPDVTPLRPVKQTED